MRAAPLQTSASYNSSTTVFEAVSEGAAPSAETNTAILKMDVTFYTTTYPSG